MIWSRRAGRPVAAFERKCGLMFTPSVEGLSDEAVHGYYIGYKYQLAIAEIEDKDLRDKYEQYTIELLMLLMDNEIAYSESIYDELGLTEEVKKFLNYNANKALMNLGYRPLFSDEECAVDPEILAPMIKEDNHDFFSGSGSTYVTLDAVDLTDEEWGAVVPPTFA